MLTARLRERRALGEADTAAMHALFDRYYEGGSRAVFDRDLAGKTHVIELRDEAGALQGFSTLEVFAVDHAGRRHRGIFSGDTIVHHEHWGEQSMALAFCDFAGRVKAEAPDQPLHWLLISKGHRTYRYLHAFARDYLPAPGRDTSAEAKALLDALCRQRFGAHYDAASGLVRLGPEGTRLRPRWADVRESLKRSDDVAFFLARNAEFARGDELACLCALEPANLRSFALRAFRQGMASAVTA